MRKTMTKLVGYAALGLVTLVVACSSGSGPLQVGSLGYENKTGDYAKPGDDGQEGTGQKPPTQGGGSNNGGEDPKPAPTSTGTGGSGGCPPCDQQFTCQVSTGGGTQTRALELKTTNGACVASGAVVITCDGKVTANGQDVGTWSRAGSTFTVKLGADTYVCAPGGTVTTDGGTNPPADAGKSG